MYRQIAVFLALILYSLPALADDPIVISAPPFCYEEEDGSPSGCYKKLKFANGNVTDNGDGTFSIADQTGAGGGDPVLIDGSAVGDGSGVDLQGGAGIAITFNSAVSPDTASFATASGEADFLASGALTCGASTQGKAQVHTTPLQYCDNAATPALQYAAYGDSSGNATSATTDTIDAITEIAAAIKDGSGECAAGTLCTGGHTHAGGSDTNSIKEFVWPASATLPLQASEAIAPIVKDAGTNSDNLAVAFDGSSDECRMVTFAIPNDVDTSGNSATFEVVWYDPAGSTASTAWDVRWHEVTDGEVWDGALTTDSVGSCTPAAGTADLIDVCTGTETFANLGWAAGDIIQLQVCRDADGTSQTDSSTADSYMHEFRIRMPRA